MADEVVTAKPRSDGISIQLALAATEAIQAKLLKVQAYFSDMARGHTTGPTKSRFPYDDGDQYALRVVRSRYRELSRVLAVRTRPVDDPYRVRSEVEMQLKRRDEGILFRWDVTNHSVGRLDCSGCEYEMAEKPGIPGAARQPLCRICKGCHEGVQHSRLVESEQEAVQAVMAFQVASGCPKQEEFLTWATPSDGGAILWACEVCGCWNLEPISK